jgi:hypothetical protein
MKTPSPLIIFGIVAALVTAVAACDTQRSPAKNLGEAWGAQLDTLPDWTGVWFLNGGFSFPGLATTVSVKDPAESGGFAFGELPGTYFTGAPYKPEYQKIYDERVRLARDEFKVYDPMASCVIPHGMPRIMGGGPGPTEIVVTPEQTTIIWDYMNEMRRIYTDGRPHPSKDKFAPTVMGHSIGHWEGHSLVVDTRFMRNGIYDRSGAPHSDQVHLMERITRIDNDTLEFQMTIEDPVMLNGPWKVTRTFRRMPKTPEGISPELEGSYCENHRNPISEDGQTAILPGDEIPGESD